MYSKRSSSKLSSSMSAAIVVGNDDLLIQIFLFLSVKSLVRFKLVSKRWCSLISAPSFCRLHTLHHPHRRRETQPLLIVGGYRSKYFVCNPTIPRIFSFEIRFGFPLVKILQSCKGLLLILRCSETKNGGNRFYVFNPITMQQRELSPLPNTSFAGIYLMFDPSLSPHYKVVCFANTKKGTLIYVYDSETHKWKLGGEPLKMGMSCSKGNGYYFNGGICFPRFRNSPFFTSDYNLSKIPNLPQLRYSLGTCNMNCAMESNGVLISLTLSWKEESNVLHVWEMNENENRWTKKYEADMNPVLASCGGGDCRAISLVGVIRGEKEKDSLLLLRVRGAIKIYQFYDDVFEDLDEYVDEFRKENREWYFSDIHNFFIQTLAPV